MLWSAQQRLGLSGKIRILCGDTLSLNPDYYIITGERLPETALAMIHWAMSRIMLRRLARAT